MLDFDLILKALALYLIISMVIILRTLKGVCYEKNEKKHECFKRK